MSECAVKRVSGPIEDEIRAAIAGVDSPTGASRALANWVRKQKLDDTQRNAARWAAEGLLAPHFPDRASAKALVWAVFDEPFANGGPGKAAGQRVVAKNDDPQARTLANILADPRISEAPEAVVPRTVFRERVTLLAMREKRGKSTYASAGAAAVSRHASFLGEETIGGRVLWVAEEHPGDLANRLTGFDADPDALFVLDLNVIRDPLADLAREVERIGPVLVVVDTLASFVEQLGLDPGSSSAWTPIMGGLTRMTRDSGAGLLLLHHGRKSDGKYRDSTAIGAGVDLLLEMSEDASASVRRISARGRWRVGDFAVQLDSDGYKLIDGEQPLAARVLAFVESYPGCSMTTAREGITGRNPDIDSALRALLAEGRIADEGDDATHAYRVVGAGGLPQ